MAQFHVYRVMGNLQKLHQREPNIIIHASHTFYFGADKEKLFENEKHFTRMITSYVTIVTMKS